MEEVPNNIVHIKNWSIAQRQRPTVTRKVLERSLGHRTGLMTSVGLSDGCVNGRLPMASSMVILGRASDSDIVSPMVSVGSSNAYVESVY